MALFILAILIKIFSLNSFWVEKYYSQGLYPSISRLLRWLFGWIPLSLGDLLYAAAFLFFVWKAWKLIRLLAQRQLKTYLSRILFRKYLKLVLWIYLLFNVLWGLNYDRRGIAGQLGLKVEAYSNTELLSLLDVLEGRLGYYASQVDTARRLRYNDKSYLFGQGVNDYEHIWWTYPFLDYRNPSIKSSLFGNSGKYFGYQGYYNPFTAEAQMKLSIPVFIKPFVLNHEIAHQLGYARENEASFVSYLTGRRSRSIEVRYSIYYEMFFQALGQLRGEPEAALKIMSGIPRRVWIDRSNEMRYYRDTENAIAPLMTEAYDKYLKLNNQPKGNATYNEVIAWLIAFMKQYGADAI